MSKRRPPHVRALLKLGTDASVSDLHRIRALRAVATALPPERPPPPEKPPKQPGLSPKRLARLHAVLGALGTSWAPLVEAPRWSELEGFSEADIRSAGYDPTLIEAS